MAYNNTNKVIDELFESLLSGYQFNLETLIERIYFWFGWTDVSQIS